MNKTPKEILHALVTSYYYNRDDADMIETLEEVQKRIKKYSCRWTDDANIIFGTLILLYGDYGTSPRGGWFDDQKAKEEILEAVKQEIKELKERIEIHIHDDPVDATDNYSPEKLKQLEKLEIKIER